MILSVARGLLAVLATVAILTQLSSSDDRIGFSYANFFSYVTIQSNVLGIVL